MRPKGLKLNDPYVQFVNWSGSASGSVKQSKLKLYRNLPHMVYFLQAVPPVLFNVFIIYIGQKVACSTMFF